MRDEMLSHRPIQKLLGCFTVIHPAPGEGGKPQVALTRIPTLKELQVIEDMVGELLYREQMDSLDRKPRF